MKLRTALIAAVACTAMVASAPAIAESGTGQPVSQNHNASRQNIVLILADDMGFSDLGAFGGEIATPNLDGLAKSGLRMTNFHAMPTCSPTRAALLSGTDNHTAGVGAMAEIGGNPARWGYEGVLSYRVASIAERLRNAGYKTLMAGKWHLGLTDDYDPHNRGFDHSFALRQGGHNHFGKGGFGLSSNPVTAAYYSEDGKIVDIPDDFYSSDYFTTKLMEEIKAVPPGSPFFAYLSFTAPHSPLQAPAQDIERYRGRYDKGWAALTQERVARMKAQGLYPANASLAAFAGEAAAWNALSPEQKRVESRKMEIYAAMVDRIDQNVGRLITQLKASGQFENTIFIFLSDNGASGATAEEYEVMSGVKEYLASMDKSFDKMGTAVSSVNYGPHWARAAMAPSRGYKSMVYEGGTRVPAIIAYPGFKRQGQIDDAYADVMDVVPTLLDVAGQKPTVSVNGRPVAPVTGSSMLPFLEGAVEQIHSTDQMIATELHGQRSVRQGRWKLVWLPKQMGGKGDWSLYDVIADPGEQIDLALRQPQRMREMIQAWLDYARRTDIQFGQ